MAGLESAFAQYSLYAWLALLVLVVVALYSLSSLRRRIAYLSHRYANLTKGVDGANLLDAVDHHVADVQDLSRRVDTLVADYRGLDERLQLSLQRVGMIRFNPFNDTGGDQSFALALLDERGDGIVLSSLFGRAESRLYAKPVQGGRSKYPLSAEEEQAIVQASQERQVV